MRPNFMAMGGYDGMNAIYEGAEEDQGRRAAKPSSTP